MQKYRLCINCFIREDLEQLRMGDVSHGNPFVNSPALLEIAATEDIEMFSIEPQA